MNETGDFPDALDSYALELAGKFGEEMQGLKRNGLPDERRDRIMNLLTEMARYGNPFKVFIQKYLADNPGVAEYKRLLDNFQIPD